MTNTRLHYYSTELGTEGQPVACYVKVTDSTRVTDNRKLVTCRACKNRMRDSVQRKHEPADMASMCRGGLRGLVKRAGEGDTDALRQLVQLQDTLQLAITDAGVLLHNFGHSYTMLAAELGVTRQAARQRFTRTTVAAGA